MKKVSQQKLPPGWNQKKVQELISYYDNQTDDEGAAEIETAPDASGETWMSVPTELVSAVARLIEGHKENGTAKNRSATRRRSQKATQT
jgi:hypothetical protein